MAVIDVQVKVSKESYELGVGVGELVAKIKEAVDDGWQAGEDFTKILNAVIAFVPSLNGVSNIPAERAEDKEAFANAIALGLTSVAGQFIK